MMLGALEQVLNVSFWRWLCGVTHTRLTRCRVA